jgi:hypothetical protein
VNDNIRGTYAPFSDHDFAKRFAVWEEWKDLVRAHLEAINFEVFGGEWEIFDRLGGIVPIDDGPPYLCLLEPEQIRTSKGRKYYIMVGIAEDDSHLVVYLHQNSGHRIKPKWICKSKEDLVEALQKSSMSFTHYPDNLFREYKQRIKSAIENIDSSWKYFGYNDALSLSRDEQTGWDRKSKIEQLYLYMYLNPELDGSLIVEINEIKSKSSGRHSILNSPVWIIQTPEDVTETLSKVLHDIDKHYESQSIWDEETICSLLNKIYAEMKMDLRVHDSLSYRPESMKDLIYMPYIKFRISNSTYYLGIDPDGKKCFVIAKESHPVEVNYAYPEELNDVLVSIRNKIKN